MKKNVLLTLVSLLVSTAVFGECNYTALASQTLSKSGGKSGEIILDYACSKIVFDGSRESTIIPTGKLSVYYWTAEGEKITEQIELSKSSEKKTVNCTKNAVKIQFYNGHNTKATIKNVKVYAPETSVSTSTTSLDFGSSADATVKKELKFNVNYSATNNHDIIISKFPDKEQFTIEGYSETSKIVVGNTCNTGSKEITVKFETSEMGVYTDLIKLSYGDNEYPILLSGIKSPNIAAPTSFTVTTDDNSYTTLNASWEYSGTATGFAIKNDNNNSLQYFEGANLRAATITGLMPGTTYSFTIYPTVNSVPSINGTPSAAVTTKQSPCTNVETISSVHLGSTSWLKPGSWGHTSDPVNINTHAAIISFKYATITGLATGVGFHIEENINNQWVRNEWSSTSSEGSGAVELNHQTKQIRFVYDGNYGADFTEIKAIQGVYVEASAKDGGKAINFGDAVKLGQSIEKKIVVDWSVVACNIISSDTKNQFSLSKTQIGENGCKHGTEEITVTYTAKEIGSQYETLNINGVIIELSANCVWPAPTSINVNPSYTTADVSWTSVSGADSYLLSVKNGQNEKIYENITDNSFTVEGLSMNTEYVFSVKSVKGKTPSEATSITESTLALAVPTLTATDVKYNDATLNWNEIEDAGSYRIVCEALSKDTIIGKGYKTLALTGLSMHTKYTFKIISRLPDGTESPLGYNSVTFDTQDLAASASITVSNASYSSVEAQWSAIPDAIGYYIVSNNGVVNVFDGHDVTSGTLVGLTPNTTYTFTIYGMHGEEVSKNSKTSNSISTLETKCDAQGEQDFTLKDCTGGGFDYNEAEKLFTTEMNAPKISFSFEAKNLGVFSVTGYKFAVKESSDNNNWSTAWETEAGKVKSGSKSVQLKKETRYIKVAYAGNFCAQFSNISIYQGSYLEVPETEIDFGNVSIGENPTKDIVVNYSTMVGNVSVSEEISDKFSIDKNQVGKDDCGYGSENIKVTFDGSEQGAYEGTITVGSVKVKVKANVTLQVPTLTASDITYNSAKLSWNAIDGAEKYKLNFIGGNSIETTDIYSVCDTLKLHSSNQFTVQAYGGGQYTDPSNVVTVNTPDLPVTTTFTLSDASYTSIHASWESVQDATGYAIKNENTGIINYYSSDITSATLVGLTPNTEYTFTLYATYNGELATNGKSAIASTLQTKCPAEEFSDKRLGEDCGIFESCAWDWSVKEYVIETGHNNPTLNFGYTVASGSTKEKSINAPDVIVYEYKNGGWQELKKVERAKSDHLSLTATDRAVRKFRITFNGNFYCDIKGVSVTQGIYFEVSPESLDFGKVKVGQSVDAKTVSVSFSTMKGDVVSGNEERFKTSKSIVGADDCGYGVETFDVTANTEVEAGTYNSNITVGSQAIPVKITIEKLPATNVSAAATGKSAISVQWDKVSGATGYKLTCADAGIDVTIPDTGSEHYSYNATGLDESTQYTFTITTMYNAIENESASASATTYATVNVIAAGEATATTSWTLTGIEGKWNKTENSFEIGSNVTIFASNSDANVIFDKIQYYDGESTVNPTTITVLDGSVAQTWAGVYYKYSGVVELNGKVYNSLDEAVEAAMAEDGQMNLLQDVPSQDLNVNCYVKFNGNGHEIGNLYIKQNGDLEIAGGVQVVNDFGLEVTADHSGQFADADNNLTVLGRAYIDKTLDPSGITNENKWYGVSFPFPVSSLEVFALVGGEEKPLTYYADYVFAAFDGNKRASSGKGFTMMTTGGATLEVGKFYMFATTTQKNTFRFYMKEGSALVNPSQTIELYEFPSSSAKNAGWNNIGNSQLYHVGVGAESTFAQVYINGENRYLTVDLSETALGVTSPMFIQQGAGMLPIATLDRKNDGTLRSAEEVQSSVYNVQIRNYGDAEVADQMFITTTNSRVNEYTVGKDLMKFEVSTAYPQIYTKAFNVNLSVYEALTSGRETDVPIFLYAPKSGNYVLSLGKAVTDGSNLYLVENGTPIYCFTEKGSIEVALVKGTNTTYSLRIEKADDITTPTDDDKDDAPTIYVENGNTLVMSNVADGKQYRIGSMSTIMKNGTSYGETIRESIVQKGTYWVELDGTVTKFEITK
ncbi:MAG: fibronectin type III domain-containing protein [Paludibacteraceae bacterium]|nr:fibronectin type III domain-containing protein [Paludibacteraceae bacterium]